MLATLPVFPCTTTDKSPLIVGGFKSAQRTRRRVSDGWPLVGFATGKASGVDVLDVDPNGMGWYSANFDALPTTRAHQTQRGLHLLFKHAEGLRCSTSRIAPGVDVKADGGYAIWWPREGLPVEDHPLCEWPDWLLKEAMTRKHGSKGDLTLLPPPSHATADVVDALRKLDPCDWRSQGNAEGYLRWLELMTGCKAAGISVEEFVAWSTSDPVYARDGDVIRRKWDSISPKHSGPFFAALRRAGISLRLDGRGSVGSLLTANTTTIQPTRNLRSRVQAIRRRVEQAQGANREPALFWAACAMAEIIAEGKLSPSNATLLLESSAHECGLRQELGREGCRRTIANGLRHVEEKLLGEPT